MKNKKLTKIDTEKIEQRALAFLAEIIKFQSFPQKGRKDTTELLRYVLEYCGSLGFRTKNIEDSVGWVEVGEGSKLMAFPLHLDVVPPGDGWEYPPFKLSISEDVMYGRGVSDNKGPVAMFIHLIDFLNSTGQIKNCRVRLIFGTSEEVGMSCIKRYLKTEELPQLGFVPDAQYPGIHGEKGRVHLQLSMQVKDQHRVNVQGGTQVNSVPDSCLVEELNSNAEVSKSWHFYGKAAHGSKPLTGENAILKGLDKISQLLSPGGPDYTGFMELFALFHEKNKGQCFSVLPEDEVFGETTSNLGLISFNANEFMVDIDIRIAQNLTPLEMKKRLEVMMPSWQAAIIESKPRHYVSPEKPIVKKMVQVYQSYASELEKAIPAAEVPQQPVTTVMGGGTYASYFAGFIAFGPSFPGIRTYAHGKNERMPLAVFRTNLKIYYTAISMLMEEQ